jgi:hypothetical protein
MTSINLFIREKTLNWVKDSIGSYFLGKTSLERLKGRVRVIIKSNGFEIQGVKTIINSLLLDPLVNTPRELVERKKGLYYYSLRNSKDGRSG